MTPSVPGDAGRLEPLAALAERLGAEPLAREAREVAARVAGGRIHVACVGQFKRGKSTLLNALVGEPVLPTGVVPVTSAITILRHGARAAIVHLDDGPPREIPIAEIARWVTEASNPENQLGVRAVELFLPSPLLERGLCLVDTPGIGSVLEGNAAVTRRFVPQIDAALVVVGGDPPITGEEVALVERIAAGVSDLLLVLAKADRLSREEREEGARFAASVLSARLRQPIGRVYEVSAAERLATGAGGGELGDLEAALVALGREGGVERVAAAAARAVARIGGALLAELDERRAALERPIAESARRLDGLGRELAAAERATADLEALLAAEERRLVRAFLERHEAFFPEAQHEARRRLDARIAALTVRRTALRGAVLETARALAAEVAERFRRELEPEAEAAYRAAMRRFVGLANEFLARAAAGAGWARPPRPLDEEGGFRVRGEFRFTALRSTTSRPPVAVLWDLARPRSRVLSSARRRAGELLDRLVETNGSRVAFDLAARAAESRRRLEREVRARLAEARDAARRALDEARRRRAEGAAAVAAEVRRLEGLREELAALLAEEAPPPSTGSDHERHRAGEGA